MVSWGRKDKADQAPPAGVSPAVPNVTTGFPRGLPDGDRNRPAATASWPSAAETAGILSVWKPGMILLGRDQAGRYYGHKDDRHVLTVAGSRAGKGVSLIVPNLLTWTGSVFAIDPKGELATLTASRRSARGSDWSVPMTPGRGKVFALDPFDRVTGAAREFAKTAAFNPMANLDVTTGHGQDLAYQIADSLIVQSEGEGAHWTQAARSLLRALILYVAATEEPDSKHLLTVRGLLMQKTDELWVKMTDQGQKEGDAYDLIARTGEAMKARRPGERSSIVSTIETQTAFIEGPEMRRVLCGSSFRLEDLKAERVTVYLCLPATRLATHGRWLRMLVTLAVDAMERTGPIKPDEPPVLFVLDEFAAMGRLEMVEKAAGQIASFGVKLWPIIQDITQLQRDYKASWETFMGNAGLLTFFGNTDLTTIEHISKRLGETEVVRLVQTAQKAWSDTGGGTRPNPVGALLGAAGGMSSSASKMAGGSESLNEQVQVVPLMSGSEVAQAFSRETKRVLATVAGKPACALYRCEYFSEEDDALFGGFYDPGQDGRMPRTTRAQREERDAGAGRPEA